MIDIFNVFSDIEKEKKLIDWFRNLELSQSLLYDNPLIYYENKHISYSEDNLINEKDFKAFWNKYIFDKWKNCLISLWCWNSTLEKTFFENWKNLNMKYIWVDSSKKMIYSSAENLKDISWLDSELIISDFGTIDFSNLIKNKTNNFDNRIFTFFWSTFWNLKHDHIVNVLSSLMKKWEKVWLDIWLRNSYTSEDDAKLTEIYINSVKKGSWTRRKLIIDSLVRNWIKESDWEIWVEARGIPGLNAFKIKFFFIFNKKVIINISGQKIYFQPWCKLSLLTIHRFCDKWLEKLFEDYDFKLIDKQLKKVTGQFIFEKV